MIQLKTAVNNALRSSFNKMIDGETREWPPKCVGFAYQPQRPKTTASTNKTSAAVTLKQNERR